MRHHLLLINGRNFSPVESYFQMYFRQRKMPIVLQKIKVMNSSVI
nr:MAG TPA: hypothetical protein [Caudoviricetes sp.]